MCTTRYLLGINTTKEKTQNKKKLLVTRLKGLRELKAERLFFL